MPDVAIGETNEAPTGTAIVASGLQKSFGRLPVLFDIHLQVRYGELMGLIGPSGCGKTALVRLLAGLSKPDEGSLSVLGLDPLRRSARERSRIGFMPQGLVLFPNLTVLQNAHFIGGLYGIGWLGRRRRIRNLLEYFELWEARDRRTSRLSGGMQRRLALACSVVHRPDVVLVDEPTAGLDPILRAKIWDYLHSLRDSGTTIVMTTQYIEEAAYCDRIAVLRGGRIILVGTPEELRRTAFQGDSAVVEGADFSDADIAALRRIHGLRYVERHRNGLRIVADDLAAATPAITQVLLGQGTPVRSIVPQIPTFDEVFTELIDRHD